MHLTLKTFCIKILIASQQFHFHFQKGQSALIKSSRLMKGI